MGKQVRVVIVVVCFWASLSLFLTVGHTEMISSLSSLSSPTFFGCGCHAFTMAVVVRRPTMVVQPTLSTRTMTTTRRHIGNQISFNKRKFPTSSYSLRYHVVPTSTATTTTELCMNNNNDNQNWFQRFFGGGAYNLQIDYSSLSFPCTELATIAQELSSNVDGGGKNKRNQKKMPSHSPSHPELELATFAGGCFWGIELAFQRVPGVVYTAVGYSQGCETYPTYDQVCAGNTGHTESVMVYFRPPPSPPVSSDGDNDNAGEQKTGKNDDDDYCSYSDLLDVFFSRIDPTTMNGQGRDYGRQYRTGVYYHSHEQEIIAREKFEHVRIYGTKNIKIPNRRIATECLPAMPFWPAEGYHQQYLSKDGVGGRFGMPQSAEKGCTDEIRCYG